MANYLRKSFRVLVSHPLDCEHFEDLADIILIRNIWPVFEYENLWNKVRSRLLKKNLKVYPPLSAKGDMTGKDHLIKLFNSGYPVIPTIDTLKDLDKFERTNDYFIKPKNKGDAVGAERLTKSQLIKRRLRNYVIQPYIDFECEVSFYVIDSKIVEAFSTPKKVGDYKIQEYSPTKEDIKFVIKFVEWNNLPFGLQRVDACRTKNGDLLLVELEDQSPFLNLADLSDKKRKKFLKALTNSLKNVLLVDSQKKTLALMKLKDLRIN